MTAILVGLAATLVVVALPSEVPRRVPAGDRRHGPDGARALATRVLERARPGRRRAQRDRQLPDAVDRIASALRAGRAVGPAIVAVAADVPAPLGAELRGVARAIEHGQPVDAAVRRWSRAEGTSADVELVAAALTLGAQAGGEVARAVDGIAATLRERHELRAEVRALATQARASAGVLAAAPVAFALLVATLEPAAVAFLVTTPVGLACLVSGILLETAGAVWMGRITRSAT